MIRSRYRDRAEAVESEFPCQRIFDPNDTRPEPVSSTRPAREMRSRTRWTSTVTVFSDWAEIVVRRSFRRRYPTQLIPDSHMDGREP
jgi:hypothetical protein